MLTKVHFVRKRAIAKGNDEARAGVAERPDDPDPGGVTAGFHAHVRD